MGIFVMKVLSRFVMVIWADLPAFYLYVLEYIKGVIFFVDSEVGNRCLVETLRREKFFEEVNLGLRLLIRFFLS